MNKIRILQFLLSFILIASINLFAVESVTLVIDESQSLQSSVDVLVNSRALNYGEYDPSGTSYFVRVTSAEIDLLGGSTNNVQLSMTARAYADIKIFNGLFGFDVDRDLDIVITGTLALNSTSPGFEIVFEDVSVQLEDENWPDWLPSYTDFINIFIALHTIELPLVNMTNVFPNVDLNYFAEATPSMIVTSDEIRLFLEVPQTTVLANKAIGQPDYLSGMLSLYNHTTPAVNQLNKPSPTTIPVRLNETHLAVTHAEILSGKKHNRWTNNIDHKMETDQFQLDQIIKAEGIIAYFDNRSPVTLTSNVSDIPIEFHDPWLVEEGEQPDEFRPISYGQYSVFLDQREGYAPTVYSVRAPHIGKVTQSDIYVFDRWEGTSVKFDNGTNSTTSRETDVVFVDAGATATAHYVSANASDVNILISAGETVQIPAGGHYISQFDPNKQSHFGFSVLGTLTISGTAANPVIFETADNNIWEGIKVYPRSPASQVNLNHCIIKDAAHIIEIREDPGTVVIDLNNCVIADSYLGIFHYSNDANITPTIVLNVDNCTFDEKVDGYNLLLYETETNLSNSIVLRDNIFYHSKIYSLIGLNAYTNCFHDCEFIEPAEIYFHNNDNIFCDPLFSSDYHLQPGSPCIDAGGVYGEYDPDGTTPDIGAYYYHQPPATPSGFTGVWYNNHPKIYWNAVSEPDLKHYEVWKKKGSAAWALRITTTATNYVDNSEFKYSRPNTPLMIYYKVRSVDEMDFTSGYTSNASFKCNEPQSDQEEFFPTVEIDPIPTEFCLHSAYPNPFNATTTLKLDLPEETRFSLAIYDISGK